MSGIVGIAKPGVTQTVQHMLDKIAYRGHATTVLETASATVGVTCQSLPSKKGSLARNKSVLCNDGITENLVSLEGKTIKLKRDPLGVTPLYYGWTKDGVLCFASEVKGLLPATIDVHELPPGHILDGRQLKSYYQLKKLPLVKQAPKTIAKQLHKKLTSAVERHVENEAIGAWLSGGLDSSVMASLARPYSKSFHTFAAGMADSSDIKYARIVANYIHSNHHEVIVKIDDLLKALPEVIYHLESFDALLVRSSIMNYLVARLAAEYVPSVFSGEGGDELFAGYHYLKTLDPSSLSDELIDITSRLHNTALQRVDRCAAAHGTEAYVGFLDPEVVEYALRIPPKYKLNSGVEKWILRQSMAGSLPEVILNRPKAKFWQGAGVEEILSQYAEEKISDADFLKKRNLKNGWLLRTKEELLYYRIFRQYFGEVHDLNWMGRTKGAPVH
jgi:asparagine synthase (glutamine-hydrolysing)